MDGPPLVSIITPSFNQVRYLETALRSVLEQDYPRIEYIVIDGGSTDGSQEVLDRYRDRLAACVSEPDAGQAAGINKGLRLAQGEIIAWLNSDDVYLPGAVRQAVEALEREPDLGMVYADGIMVDSEQMLLDRHRYRALSLVDLLSFEVLLQPTVFMRRHVLEQAGYLDDSYQLILDHQLWVRMAARAPVRHVKVVWALERTHGEAKTIARAAGFVEEAQRMLRWAESSPELSGTVRHHQRRIQSGFNVFAARRLIDAGEYRRAFRHILTALGQHPPTVARYWYKFVQAAGSALGMAGVFFWYRRTRRNLQYGHRRIEPGAGADLRPSRRPRLSHDRTPCQVPTMLSASRESLPLVTIVTPSFNQVRFLEATIESVLSQDYPRIEYIVLDGGSTDGSVDILRKHADRLATWASEPDRGQTDAINRGFGMAHGDILAWLNSDDVYYPGAVSEAVAYLQAHPEIGMVHGEAHYLDEAGLAIARFPSARTSHLDLRRGAPRIAQQAAFFRTVLWKMVGPLDPTFQYAMDYDLWVRISAVTTLAYVPALWAGFRLHGESKSMTVARQCWPEMMRVHYRDGGSSFSILNAKYLLRRVVEPAMPLRMVLRRAAYRVFRALRGGAVDASSR